MALRLAPLVVALGRALGPVASGLIKVANVILLGKGLPEGPFVTEGEIKAMAEVASEEESIEEKEKDLIHSIFEFGDTVVREVMVPRPDMVMIDVNRSLKDVLDLVIRHGYSRIPVYRGTPDEIVGVVFAKDVLRELHGNRQDRGLADLARKPYFVPESKKVADLLKEMQRDKFHLAIVVDEYGTVSGLVTLEDLLEEIVGEIVDECDREEPQVEPAGENRYRVNIVVAKWSTSMSPTAQWVALQMVEAFLWDTAPRYLLRDRDAIYGERFRRRVQEVLTAPRSPWQNPYVERIIGSIRRDCLDHIIVLNDSHLKRILTSYFDCYHRWRTHLGLAMDTPQSRDVQTPDKGKVIEITDLGGLHHHYLRLAA